MKSVLPVTQYTFNVTRHTQKRSGEKLSKAMGAIVLTEAQLIAFVMASEGATKAEITQALGFTGCYGDHMHDEARRAITPVTGLAHEGQYALGAALKVACADHAEASAFPIVKGACKPEAIAKAAKQLGTAYQSPNSSWIGSAANLEVFRMTMEGMSIPAIKRQGVGNPGSVDTTCTKLEIPRKEAIVSRVGSLLGVVANYSATLVSVTRPEHARTFTFAEPVKPLGFKPDEFADRSAKSLDLSCCGRSGCAGVSGFMPSALR